MVAVANAVVDEGTVMVHLQDATLAGATVMGPGRLRRLALLAHFE